MFKMLKANLDGIIGGIVGGFVATLLIHRHQLPKGEWECYEAKAKLYIHVSVK